MLVSGNRPGQHQMLGFALVRGDQRGRVELRKPKERTVSSDSRCSPREAQMSRTCDAEIYERRCQATKKE